ncbi:C40 family peptidase [uncultured Jatrophihabitans sp.]|uniref:C40 family peptidase n=1 Tax=uncultured Jatrophihabitans sp. TaxID=1610747 RepID=UPI0035CC3C49
MIIAGTLALCVASVAVVAPGAGAATHASTSQRIVTVAKKYVGHARYRYGGSSPKHGFDCSGFTKYVYKKAHVAKLPHNAERQRDMHRVEHVSKKHRKVGDLVFYMSGGDAYHVAIYAGHNKTYSATDPRQGITHKKIHGKHIRYGRLKS